MDGFIEKPTRECPHENVNFISSLFFWWMKDLFVLGARKDLELSDMFRPMKNDESERVTDRLERAWKREKKKLKKLEYASGSKKKPVASREPSLLRAICAVFWWDYLKAGTGIVMIAAVLRTLQPLFQRGIINYFGGSGGTTVITEKKALYDALGLTLTTAAVVIISHHSTLHVQKAAMKIRLACSSLIYRKILRLSKSALNHTTPGQIVNLLSNDVGRFDVLAALLNQLWIMPIQVCVIGTVMYTIIGPVALIGLSSLLLVVLPLLFIITKYSKIWRRDIAVLTDRRIQLMSELINGIQVVKMYAWETPFSNVVSKAREAEMRAIRKTTHLKSFSLAMSMFSDKLNLFLTLLAYVLLGNTLTADIAFTIGMYFTTLQAGSFFFPQAVILGGEAAVSVRRLQDFLLLDELSNDRKISSKNKGHENPAYESDETVSHDQASTISQTSDAETSTSTLSDDVDDDNSTLQDPIFIEMQRISANWIIGQLPPTLCDVSMKIHGGEICALVGKVGSGKSSLLNVFLKELPIESGNLYLRQRFDTNVDELTKKFGYVTDNRGLTISYTSQDPWLYTGTVRDNILFGQPYDAMRYHDVTRVCALWRDMRQWPHGDMTVVGERGIALSGGQKARVNLARAVYKQADLYLLDDPLSAVDPRVGRHLFKKCICGYLNGKTRILVTHQLQYLKNVDTIVVLDRGFVKAQGTFEDLSKSSSDFASLMDELKQAEGEKEKEDARTEETKVESSTVEQLDNVKRWASIDSIDSLTMSVDYGDDGSVSSHGHVQPPEFVSYGNIPFSVWYRYFRAGGSLFVIIFLSLIVIVAQLLISGTDVWVSYWSNVEAARSSLVDLTIKNSVENSTFFSYFGLLDDNGLLSRSSAIDIYTGLVIACVIVNMAQSFMFFAIAMNSSDNLHESMFRSLIHATMRFFNANVSGRILNRFSRDVGIMDESLPRTLMLTLRLVLTMLSAFIMVVVINRWMIIPLIFLVIGFYTITVYYLKTAYDIKRIESMCKSPSYSQVNATLQGLATIRSNGPALCRALCKQFDVYQDVHTGAWYIHIATATAFRFWLDLLALIFVGCSCFSLILLDDGNTTGGMAGLILTSAIQLTGMLQFCVKQGTDASSFMTSIEQILQYIEIPSEGSPTSDNPPPPNWPTKGRLTMKNVFLSYTDDNLPVLNSLNLTIEPGWKVGVVGRTGAGKSSLISALFRLENEGLEGEIKIDGRDTSTLGLRELRSSISIIPQQSVLFSGTLRYNLDPFGIYDDAALCDALREVELGDLSLDHRVSEGGSNFSVGQRQLVCLARAIMKNNRILVLDEVTANIDASTDALIQKTLRTKFAKHTVITVAHRLITVIQSDRIVLMDEGRVIEFGCPHELLSDNPDGPFAKMVHQSEPTVAENLIRLAASSCLQVTPIHSLDLASSNSDEHSPTTDHR